MKTYYIYHIPWKQKIGVTENLPRRKRQHSVTDIEILEEHTCIYEVSYRERDLQIQYGYPVDKRLYFEWIAETSKGGQIGGRNTSPAGGLVGGQTNKKSGHIQKISGNYSSKHPNKKRMVCEHCGKEGQYIAMKRHHGDNCKKKGPISESL